MVSTKYILMAKESLVTVALVDDIESIAQPESYFIVPYKANWHTNTELVFLLLHIGNRNLPTKLEVLHDIQIDQSTMAKSGIYLEIPIDDTNGGFESYANEALASLMEQLNQGLSTSRDSQPHIDFEFNNNFFQWAVVPV